MDAKARINELLEMISNDEKYDGCVFEARCIYFVIANGKLLEIPDNDGCGPKGGCCLEVVKGPTAEENDFIESMMDELDFDECFFSEIIDDFCGVEDIEDEDILDYFEENEDEDSLAIYKKMRRKIKSAKSPFEDLTSFIIAVTRYGLDSDTLYYEYEGDYIDLHNNICETGEPMGEFDNLSDDEWINVLENIDRHIVKA